MEQRRALNQKGFTLIEIIAVLVILGIMAAVAVPKYTSMQNQAVISAASGAVAAGSSNVQLEYASELMAGTYTSVANLITNLSVAGYQNVGDFTVAYTTGTGTIAVLVTASGTSTSAPASLATQWTAATGTGGLTKPSKNVVLVP